MIFRGIFWGAFLFSLCVYSTPNYAEQPPSEAGAPETVWSQDEEFLIGDYLAAQGPVRPELLDAVESLREYAMRREHRGEIPGMIMGLYHMDRPVLRMRWGLAWDTVFAVASVTKSLAALAVLQLAAIGLVDLNDPIDNYLDGVTLENPRFGGRRISVLQVLQHRSGIPYDNELIDGWVVSPVSGFAFKVPRPVHKPGYSFNYSNHNYFLIYHLVEKVTGMSFVDVIAANLLEPLDMRNSFMGGETNGATGLYTTLEDLSHLAQIFLTGGNYQGVGIIDPHYLRKVFQPPQHVLPDVIAALLPNDHPDFLQNLFRAKPVFQVGPRTQYYGFGWEVMLENNRVRHFHHTGAWSGILAEVHVFPWQRAFLITLGNPPWWNSAGVTRFRDETERISEQTALRVNELFP